MWPVYEERKRMPTDVVMPQMGESIFEGTITKWLKKAGDAVEVDEPLFEISTDKVDAEIPAPVAGILTEIRALEGATVAINTVVAVIGSSSPSAADGSTGDKVPVAAPVQSAPQVKPAAAAPVATKTVPTPQQVPAKAVAVHVQRQAGEAFRSSPLVRRIARESNVDLSLVAGTGPNGRITKEDILGYLSAPPPVTVSAPKAPTAALYDLPGEVVSLSRMRAIIAQRMVESKQISPHVHTVYRIDMTRIVKLRERERAGFEQRNGVKLTYMPFIATAAGSALKKFPVVNASLAENAIHYHANVNLGIAVALEWGLIVPVVRKAEEMSFVELARTIADVASRARSKKLSPDELGGSTFTLTNSGVFDDVFSTPIINQPESAILCISGLNKEPVVLTDDEGNDTVAIRSMQHFTLGFDHRLIDGSDGCRFMVELKRVLENWDTEIG